MFECDKCEYKAPSQAVMKVHCNILHRTPAIILNTIDQQPETDREDHQQELTQNYYCEKCDRQIQRIT